MSDQAKKNEDLVNACMANLVFFCVSIFAHQLGIQNLEYTKIMSLNDPYIELLGRGRVRE